MTFAWLKYRKKGMILLMCAALIRHFSPVNSPSWSQSVARHTVTGLLLCCFFCHFITFWQCDVSIAGSPSPQFKTITSDCSKQQRFWCLRLLFTIESRAYQDWKQTRVSLWIVSTYGPCDTPYEQAFDINYEEAVDVNMVCSQSHSISSWCI